MLSSLHGTFHTLRGRSSSSRSTAVRPCTSSLCSRAGPPPPARSLFYGVGRKSDRKRGAHTRPGLPVLPAPWLIRGRSRPTCPLRPHRILKHSHLTHPHAVVRTVAATPPLAPTSPTTFGSVMLFASHQTLRAIMDVHMKPHRYPRCRYPCKTTAWRAAHPTMPLIQIPTRWRHPPRQLHFLDQMRCRHQLRHFFQQLTPHRPAPHRPLTLPCHLVRLAPNGRTHRSIMRQ